MSKKFKSKFFRVAVEGATTDGRQIERKWLQEIAETYNRAKYGARVFIEHIRGLNPEWGFRCMGDVLAVKAEEVEVDGKKRLALFAQIEPTAEMLALNKAGQKIYSSIEVTADFAGTGKAYLMGLGVTDSPASLGTEVLAFAAQNPAASPFQARKQAPENLFSAAELSEIEFEEITETDGPSLMDRIKAIFSKSEANADERFADVHSAVEQVATEAAAASHETTALRAEFSALKAQLADAKAANEKAFADIAALTEQIDKTAAGNPPARPAATGGPGIELTDC